MSNPLWSSVLPGVIAVSAYSREFSHMKKTKPCIQFQEGELDGPTHTVVAVDLGLATRVMSAPGTKETHCASKE